VGVPGWAATASMHDHPGCLHQTLMASEVTLRPTADAQEGTISAAAGVESWALWVPSPITDLDTADAVRSVGGMTRDPTTLVMTLGLPDRLPSHPGVLQTTVDVAARGGEVPLPADGLPGPDETRAVHGWVLVHDEHAVAGAWTYLNGRDVGVYAVGTVSERVAAASPGH
jgi:hypothetical protein